MKTTAEPELGFLLEDLQTPNPQLADRFHEAAGPILRRMARKRSYGLPADVANEVVQETFLSLLNPNLLKFDSSRGTASQYLQGRALNAVKTTQVAYGMRRTGSDFEAEPQREYVPIDDEMQLVSKDGVDVDAILAKQSLHRLFANVDEVIFDACVRVYGDDESQSAVAEEINISRFVLARQMTAARASAVQMLMVA